MLRLLIAKKVWKKHPLLLHHWWCFFFSFFLSGFFLFLFQCWWWPRNGSKHHHVSDFRRLSPKTINYTRAYLFCLPKHLLSSSSSSSSRFSHSTWILLLNWVCANPNNKNGGKKKNKQTNPEKEAHENAWRKTHYPTSPNPKERFTPRAKPGGKNTHNERTSTNAPAFFSLFLSPSIAVDTTGLRTSGKKEEESQARSHSRNALAGSKRQGGRWWWGAL